MRTFLAVCLLIVLSAPLASANQWPVVVTTEGGQKIRGRMLAMTTERLTLSRDGRLEPIPMERVVRVVKPRDSVLDGFLKGLVVGLLPLLAYGDGVDGRFAARYVLTHAVIGMGIDAMQGERVVLYDRAAPSPPQPTLALKLRF